MAQWYDFELEMKRQQGGSEICDEMRKEDELFFAVLHPEHEKEDYVFDQSLSDPGEASINCHQIIEVENVPPVKNDTQTQIISNEITKSIPIKEHATPINENKKSLSNISFHTPIKTNIEENPPKVTKIDPTLSNDDSNKENIDNTKTPQWKKLIIQTPKKIKKKFMETFGFKAKNKQRSAEVMDIEESNNDRRLFLMPCNRSKVPTSITVSNAMIQRVKSEKQLTVPQSPCFMLKARALMTPKTKRSISLHQKRNMVKFTLKPIEKKMTKTEPFSFDIKKHDRKMS